MTSLYQVLKWFFQEGDTESCITFNAILDTHFDWAHDIYLDISNPSNGTIFIKI